MDNTPQWPQGIGVSKCAIIQEKKPRPQKEAALNCPRCASTNTKFCYYNNYSLSQPRYFCKTCRRYWTDGGSLRSVPVGGGSRKNRRSSSSGPTSSSSSSKKLFASDPHLFSPQNQNQNQNPKIHQSQDLNLAYNPPHGISELVSLPFQNSAVTTQHFPFFSSLMAESNSVYSPGGFPEFKPSLGFSVDNNYGNNNNNIDQGVNSRVSFPFEELNKQEGAHFAEERETGERDNNSNAYWNGMIAGGSW